MSKNKLLWFWFLLAVATLCLIGIMFYHPIWLSRTLFFFSMCIIVETFIIAVVLCILRKTDMLTSWKTGVYLAVAVVGMMAPNFLLSPIYSGNILPFALSVFAFFVFLNIGLSLVIFDVSFWKACLIGVIAGLINAFMVITTITVCP